MSLAACFTQSLSMFEFQRHNHQGLMFRRVLFDLNYGLNEDDVIEELMIPFTFNEETQLSTENNLNSLKRH
jgi:hypothetical protein